MGMNDDLRAAAQAATPSLTPDGLRALLMEANRELGDIDELRKKLRIHIEGIEGLLATGYFDAALATREESK